MSGQHTDSGTVHIVIDTTGPQVTVPNDFSENEGDTVNLTGSATDTGGSGVYDTGWGAITATPDGNSNNQHVDAVDGKDDSFVAMMARMWPPTVRPTWPATSPRCMSP